MRISRACSSSAAYTIAFSLAFSAVAPALASPLFYEAAGQFVSAVQAAAAAQASGSATSGVASAGASVTPAQIKAGNTTGYLFYQCKNPGQMAITFDDGPQVNHTKIRQLLDKYNAKGTFFVNGMNYDCIYNQGIAESIQVSYQEGHQFATHTWGHVDITKLTTAQLNNNMQLVEDAVMKILGVKPAMFRPPYGNFNNDALATVASRGYTAVIIWDVISGAATGMNIQQSLNNYASAIKDGQPHIVLQHEQDADSFANIYDQVFTQLVAAKKQLVTVAQCLNMAPYISTSQIGKRDSTWTCDGKPGPGQPGR